MSKIGLQQQQQQKMHLVSSVKMCLTSPVPGPFPVLTGNFFTEFIPLYPQRLWIDERAFCNAFPFHIVFDKNVRHDFCQSILSHPLHECWMWNEELQLINVFNEVAGLIRRLQG